MSTATPQPAPTPGQPPLPAGPREIRIYGHTLLFYWWPVWLAGYILGLLTYVHDSRLAIVPSGSAYVAEEQRKIVLPPHKELESSTDLKERVHPNKNLGVIFAVVLFVVILITTVPLRGLSSAIAIMVILLLTVLFAWMNWWDDIFRLFGLLAIHINLGFYLVFSTVLLVAWLLVFFVYDRLSYWRVTPGQITHEFVFGAGQRSFDTGNMAFEKLRDDLFRHWILGFGSGDMVMYPMTAASSSREELQIHNVLFVGTKLRKIQELIAEKPE
jgi:lysylphosphatidylglycerol synthetase-like protein (DUF2156 family)